MVRQHTIFWTVWCFFLKKKKSPQVQINGILEMILTLDSLNTLSKLSYVRKVISHLLGLLKGLHVFDGREYENEMLYLQKQIRVLNSI